MTVKKRQRVELPAKLLFLLDDGPRYKVAYGGRGGAKSWTFARALLTRGAKKPLRIGCGREIMDSIADSVHKLLVDQIGALGLEAFYDVQKNAIRGANGTEFFFVGLRQQDAHKIKSLEGCDVFWVEEAQAVSERSWQMLTPTIRKPGSEIWVSFNPELDSDPTYARFVLKPPANARVVEVNYPDNPWLTKELEQERLDSQARDTADVYANVWEGKCKTVVDGAIYKAEIEALYREPRRVMRVPHDPSLPVHTVWDLGWNDAMSIIPVQRSAAEVRVIGYIEDSHKTLAEYISILREQWPGVIWGTDWLPHDGASRDIKTGKSSEEVLRALGRNVRIIARGDVEEGIKAARMMFPRCYFDEDRAGGLVNRLKRYRRAIPVATGEPGQPVHDENSHGADAFRGLAMIVDQISNNDERRIIDMSFKPASGGASEHGWMGA